MMVIDDVRAAELLKEACEDPGISQNLRSKIRQLLADGIEQQKQFAIWANYLDKDNFADARRIIGEYRLQWGDFAPNLQYMESLTSFMEYRDNNGSEP